MKKFRRYSSQPFQRFCTLASLLLTSSALMADVTVSPSPAPPPRRPNVLERVGNFFYNLSHGTERSMIPDYPGYNQQAPDRRQAPLKSPRGAAKPAPGSAAQGTQYLNPTPSTTPTNVPRKDAGPQGKATVPLPDDQTKAVSPGKPSPEKISPQPLTKEAGKEYPMGTPGSQAGRVKSPYPPFRELDATGLAKGSLAMDPVSGKVFRVP